MWDEVLYDQLGTTVVIFEKKKERYWNHKWEETKRDLHLYVGLALSPPTCDSSIFLLFFSNISKNFLWFEKQTGEYL